MADEPPDLREQRAISNVPEPDAVPGSKTAPPDAEPNRVTAGSGGITVDLREAAGETGPIVDPNDDSEDPGETVADDFDEQNEGETSEAEEPSEVTLSALQLIADQPISDPANDLLGARPLAEALAAMVASPETDTPLTVCLSGPWGSGKTSVARMTEHLLATAPGRATTTQPSIVWFNAWQHEDAPNLGTALAAAVTRELDRDRRLIHRVRWPIPSAILGRSSLWFRRVRRALVAVAAVGSVTAALAGTGRLEGITSDDLGDVVLPGIPVVIGLALWILTQLNTLSSTLGSFVKARDDQAAKGTIAQVRTQVGRLVGQVTGRYGSPRRVVIFVDDLDRSSPERAVELCETVAQLLDHQDLIVVLLADLQVLERAVETTRADTAKHFDRDAHRGASYGRAFVQKLVHFQIRLPVATEEQLRTVASRRSSPTRTGQARRMSFRAWWHRFTTALPAGLVAVGLLVGTAVILVVGNIARNARSWQWAWWLLFGYLGLLLLTAIGFSIANLVLGRSRKSDRERLSLASSLDPDLALQLIGLSLGMGLVGAGGAAFTGWQTFTADGYQWAWGIGFALALLAAWTYWAEAAKSWQVLQDNQAYVQRVFELAASEIDARLSATHRPEPDEVLDAVERAMQEAGPRPGFRSGVAGRRRLDFDDLRDDLRQYVKGQTAETVALRSVFRYQAEQAALKYLTPLPRQAIRLVNRLRFLIHVAQRSDLLGDPRITATRIGKWAVLSEQWPELVNVAGRDPTILAHLEEAARGRGGAFRRALAGNGLAAIDGAEDLQGFLADRDTGLDPDDEQTRLGPVAAELVRLQPTPAERHSI